MVKVSLAWCKSHVDSTSVRLHIVSRVGTIWALYDLKLKL